MNALEDTLLAAAALGDTVAVRAALAAGADPELPDPYGRTALDHTVRHGLTGIATLLEPRHLCGTGGTAVTPARAPGR
ncbi:hypothetical protein [Streptomyces zaomyceticus]|uniref:hypothetical protein n=1 Tax=Streptomyces zaomyceticus TaxID=68286 RepID=UPI003249CCDD